jgi:hypothetical protein
MLREGFTLFDICLTRAQLQPPGEVSGKCRDAPFARRAGHVTRRSNKELPSSTNIQTAALFLASISSYAFTHAPFFRDMIRSDRDANANGYSTDIEGKISLAAL